MKISIIIPTYKGHTSISIAIQSILKQKYNDFEILVCDDNPLQSEEQLLTEKCVNSFNNKNIVYLKNGHKNGSAARNTGIKHATGDIISLLDDDDYFLDGYLESVNNFFINNTNVTLLFFDVNVILKEGISRLVSNPDITPKKLLFGEKEIGTGSNICFRKTVESEFLFDERYTRHQDIEFILKLMSKYKYFWIQEAKIVKYYNGTNNFPNVDLALEMQELLRNDMYNIGLISDEECKKLKNKQLVMLYNDLLIRKAPLKEIKKIRKIIVNNKCDSLYRKGMYIVYAISKNLFCFIAKTILNNKQNILQQKTVNDLLKYRNDYLAK